MRTITYSPKFRVTESKGRFHIKCLLPNHTPTGRRISEKDMRYLRDLSPKEFNNACVMDYGVGVFQRKTKR